MPSRPIAEMKKILRTPPPGFKAVFIQETERSTGVRNDVQARGRPWRGADTVVAMPSLACGKPQNCSPDEWAHGPDELRPRRKPR